MIISQILKKWTGSTVDIIIIHLFLLLSTISAIAISACPVSNVKTIQGSCVVLGYGGPY